ELNGKRFREQARIALGDARTTAFAHADLDNAERLERAQRIARHDAACVETGGKVFFGAEKIAGLELLGEEGIAEPGNDLRRQRWGAPRKQEAGGNFATHHSGLWRRGSGQGSALVSP